MLFLQAQMLFPGSSGMLEKWQVTMPGNYSPRRGEGGELPAPKISATLSGAERGQQLQLRGGPGRHPPIHRVGPRHGWDSPLLPSTSAATQSSPTPHPANPPQGT